MSYVVLARKWRPQSFEDLVGQDHVATTLGNAIAHNRVAHAFLFTGVRGVGKTTSARILAKALNCQEGPTAKPCQKCSQCMEIAAGHDVDVQEIDGASYNGVDEVRKLQESLPYRPSRDRFKIFIVDEVHMLSNAAWNAFLKTLEEPPPHVKFIFATTEVHKVPVTILSRCQRYDFKLLTAKTIAGRLRYVLKEESVQADDAAVASIAREAAGSMRDGMSLLDQVIAWTGSDGEMLTAASVSRVLGVAARSVLHRLGEALAAGDASTCLTIVGDLTQQGFDLPHVARDFLAHLRDLTVAKVASDPSALLDLADEEIADVKALAEKTSVDDLTRLHQGFSKAFDDIVRSGQPRAALEMTLVRLARRPPLLAVDELLRRLGELERRLSGSGAPAGGAPGGGGGGGGYSAGPRDRGAPQPPRGGPPARSASAPLEQDPPSLPAQPASAASAPAPWPVSMEPSGSSSSSPSSSFSGSPSPSLSGSSSGSSSPSFSLSGSSSPSFSPSGSSSPSDAPRPSPTPPANTPALSRPLSPSGPPAPTFVPAANGTTPSRPNFSDIAPSLSATPPPSAASSNGAPSPNAAAPPSAAISPNTPSFPNAAPSPRDAAPRGFVPEAPAGAPLPASNRASPVLPSSPPGRPSADRVEARALVPPAIMAAWRTILEAVRLRRPALASVLEHASLLQCDGARVLLGYEPGSFLAAQATDAAAIALLTAAVREHFGATTEVAFDLAVARGTTQTIAQIDGAERKARVEAARRAVADHPLVSAAIELLGAELRDVRLSQDYAD